MNAAQRSYDEIIDVFARGGGAGTVLAFRPSAEARARVQELLARNKAGTLTDDEQAELDRFGELEHLMQLVKARAAALDVTPAPLPAALRRLIRERAATRCEYCLLAEDDAFLPHEADHIVAVKHGGATEASNLALACFDDNRYKGSDLASLDPATGLLTPLFNPRVDKWLAHFAIEGGRIVPRTAIARVTVALLRFNLPVRVEVCTELATLGRWPCSSPIP